MSDLNDLDPVLESPSSRRAWVEIGAKDAALSDVAGRPPRGGRG